MDGVDDQRTRNTTSPGSTRSQSCRSPATRPPGCRQPLQPWGTSRLPRWMRCTRDAVGSADPAEKGREGFIERVRKRIERSSTRSVPQKCRGWRRANGSSERCTRGCSSTTAQRLCRRSRPFATNCVRVTTAVAAWSPSSDPEEDYVPATEHEVTEWMADLHEEMNAALVSGNPMEAARISGLITMRPRVSNPQRCLLPWCCNGEVMCERRDSLYGCRGVVSRRRRRVSSSSAETFPQSAPNSTLLDGLRAGFGHPSCSAQDMCERAAQIMPSRPPHS